MTVSAQVEMAGVKDTIRALGSIDKELVKEFKAKAAEIAAPAIRAAQAEYRRVPLSGMERKWQGGRIFPFNVGKAQKGVRFRLDYRRNAIGVLNIEQRDAGAVSFVAAGLSGGFLGRLAPVIDLCPQLLDLLLAVSLIEPPLCVDVERFEHDDRRLPSQSCCDLVRFEEVASLLDHRHDALALTTKAQAP